MAPAQGGQGGQGPTLEKIRVGIAHPGNTYPVQCSPLNMYTVATVFKQNCQKVLNIHIKLKEFLIHLAYVLAQSDKINQITQK